MERAAVSMDSAPGRIPSRLPGLDLLRAVAILAVLGTHAWVAGGMGPGFDWLANYGWIGVDLFFVLSGYLIGRQFLARLARGGAPDLKDFYRQRAYRILPAYVAVLLLYFCITGFREFPAMQPTVPAPSRCASRAQPSADFSDATFRGGSRGLIAARHACSSAMLDSHCHHANV